MKTILIIGGIAFALVVGGYIYTKQHILKVRDFKPDKSKAKSILDLRPAIIAKLQQMVKDGSNGLYILSIHNIEPDIFSSTLDVHGASIVPDSNVMKQLDQSQKLPDDIFNIQFASLHIDGIGIQSLFQRDNIDIKIVDLAAPLITIDHKNRKYNAADKERNEHLTIYQRLMNDMKKIAIGKINILHGRLVLRDEKNKTTEFNDICINLTDLLMDSTTQYDRSRFLFSKHANIETSNYKIGTPDSLYFIKLRSIAVTAEQHEIAIANAELQPRGNIRQFEKKLKGREEMYHVVVPKIVFSNIDWWSLINRENLFSKQMIIHGGSVDVFFDKSLPPASNEPMNHFPHQLITQIPFPVFINKIKAEDVKVVYTQYNPKTRSTGTSYFTKIGALATHVTNMRSEIMKRRFTDFSGEGLFMNKVPIKVKLKFDMLNTQTGEFSGNVHMDSLTKDLVNPISEPLGQFTIKSGEMQKGDAKFEGNNSAIKGKITFYYTNLHIIPLKKDSSGTGLQKNHLKSFFANWFLIKNSNPEGKLRTPSFSVPRDSHQNFVSFIWTSILTGMVKTIGLPVKAVVKDE